MNLQGLRTNTALQHKFIPGANHISSLGGYLTLISFFIASPSSPSLTSTVFTMYLLYIYADIDNLITVHGMYLYIYIDIWYLIYVCSIVVYTISYTSKNHFGIDGVLVVACTTQTFLPSLVTSVAYSPFTELKAADLVKSLPSKLWESPPMTTSTPLKVAIKDKSLWYPKCVTKIILLTPLPNKTSISAWAAVRSSVKVVPALGEEGKHGFVADINAYHAHLFSANREGQGFFQLSKKRRRCPRDYVSSNHRCSTSGIHGLKLINKLG